MTTEANQQTTAIPATGPNRRGSPDAQLIRLSEEFLAAEIETEAQTAHLADLAPEQWTAKDRALDAASSADVRRYHERLEAISIAEPTTAAGLCAQARVMLWHTKHPSGDEVHAWNLAESVLRVCGQPMPAWASADGGCNDGEQGCMA